MIKEPKTGLFFGSFNPIHTGHLILAQYFLSFSDIQEIWFVVSPENPLKDKGQLLEDVHRLRLVEAAINKHPRFWLCDAEFQLPKPSYTIDTLTSLRKSNPNRPFILIMGEDILPSLSEWKDYERILEENTLYVYPRPGSWHNPYTGHPSITFFGGAPMIEISSTFIRESISKGIEMHHFLPEAVYDLIRNKGYYLKP